MLGYLEQKGHPGEKGFFSPAHSEEVLVLIEKNGRGG